MGPRAVSTDTEPGKNPGWKAEVPGDDEVPKGRGISTGVLQGAAGPRGMAAGRVDLGRFAVFGRVQRAQIEIKSERWGGKSAKWVRLEGQLHQDTLQLARSSNNLPARVEKHFGGKMSEFGRVFTLSPPGMAGGGALR